MPGNDSYVVSLLHMEGADASVIFNDSANGSGHVWTPRGTAQIDTAQFKFGAASGLFDGNSDWIDTPDHADWNFGSGDFTIDFWVRFSVVPTSGNIQVIATQWKDAGNYWDLFLYNNGGNLQWWFNVVTGGVTLVTVTKSAATINADAWYHVALVRYGNIWRFFQGGVQCGTDVTDTDAVGDYDGLLYVGKLGTNTTPYYFDGWLDEFRISKGVARWTAGFAPSAEAYKTAAEDDPLWTVWNSFGCHFDVETTVFDSTPNSAKCKTFIADESIALIRGIAKTISWGSIKMTGEFRVTALASSTCQMGCYYPLASTGQNVQALQFGASGHFTYNDGAGNAHHLFPNDKTYLTNTWYTWEVIFDFVNSLQKTKVDGVDLGDIALKDIAGTTLTAAHTITSFAFVGSSDAGINTFYLDTIEVKSYPDDTLLFSCNFDSPPPTEMSFVAWIN